VGKWFEEMLQAPRDAVALLLGLVAAFSVLALLRHEFASEPLRVVFANWNYWSHLFWQFFADLIDIEVNSRESHMLTATIMVWAVFLRGYFRAQIVTLGLPVWAWGLICWVSFHIGGFWLSSSAVELPYPEDGKWLPPIVGMICLATFGIGIAVSLLKAPRSFFGIVIAAIALLLIDKIPLLPAATP
jgi:hypothetical protein